MLKRAFGRVGFPLGVLLLYAVLWSVEPEKTLQAVRRSLAVGSQVLPPLCLVFVVMVCMNRWLKPPQFTAFLQRGATVTRWLLAAAAGFVSTGPIYAWYPLLKDVREKGTPFSLLAVFLGNRAVKPFLIPVMVSFFGWPFVVILTGWVVAGSFCVGLVVAIMLDDSVPFERES